MKHLKSIIYFAFLLFSFCCTASAYNFDENPLCSTTSAQSGTGYRQSDRSKDRNNQLTKKEIREGWQLLFDGKHPDKWRGINKESFPSSGWKVENEELIVYAQDGAESGNGGDIITKKQYSSFILEWEWMIKTKGGNSGVKYLVQEGIGSNDSYGYGLEYQILDDVNFTMILNGEMKLNDNRTMGSLYYIYPASLSKKTNPLGTWNRSKIVCKGNYVEHWLNGQKILQYDRGSDDFKSKIQDSKFKDISGYGLWPRGFILLQDHGSIVHFRNMKIKELN